MAKSKKKNNISRKKQNHVENKPPVKLPVSELIRSAQFRFTLAFAVSSAAIYALIHLLPPWLMQPVNVHTASMLGLVLSSLRVPVWVTDDVISGGGVAFRIISECTPVFSFGIFFSFVAFYPSSLREKATGLITGLPLLYMGNLLRLLATFLVSRYDRNLFDLAHTYLGQVFTIFLVILACVLWLQWLNYKASEPSASMKVLGFLGLFALISACLFLIWLKIHREYITLLDQFVLLGFYMFDWRLIISANTIIYYETFNVVTFVSLVFASLSVNWSRKLKGLALGLGALFLFHLLHRIDNMLISGFSIMSAIPFDYVVCTVGQYILPFLLWLIIIRRFPPGKEQFQSPDVVRI